MRRSRAKTPMFTRVRLANWRNFAQVDVALQRRMFLVGPNASGKSNFLDAFRFLHDLAAVGGGFQEAIIKRDGVSKLRCLAARKHSDIVVDVSVGGMNGSPAWQYELAFNQDNRSRPFIKSEVVKRNGDVILKRPNKTDDKDK